MAGAPGMTEFVFGYGSLADAGEPASLTGHRREWRVAMDNSQDLPGYKYYVDPVTGDRPRVFVAFLDLVPASDATVAVNGVLIPVDDRQLAALDARERNYERREVTIPEAVEGGASRVWAYFGTAAARYRFRRGRAEGKAVISADYEGQVRASFERLGPGELERFDTSTRAHDLQACHLRRIDVPQPD